MQKEIDDARSTADPSLQYECTTLNVNGECLDHLDYTKGTTVIFDLYGVGSLAPSLIKGVLADFLKFVRFR